MERFCFFYRLLKLTVYGRWSGCTVNKSIFLDKFVYRKNQVLLIQLEFTVIANYFICNTYTLLKFALSNPFLFFCLQLFQTEKKSNNQKLNNKKWHIRLILCWIITFVYESTHVSNLNLSLFLFSSTRTQHTHILTHQ